MKPNSGISSLTPRFHRSLCVFYFSPTRSSCRRASRISHLGRRNSSVATIGTRISIPSSSTGCIASPQQGSHPPPTRKAGLTKHPKRGRALGMCPDEIWEQCAPNNKLLAYFSNTWRADFGKDNAWPVWQQRALNRIARNAAPHTDFWFSQNFG